MSNKDIILSLKNIKNEIIKIQEETISETIYLQDVKKLTEKKENNYTDIEFELKKIKNKFVKKINPITNKYSAIQLLKLYPFYYLSLRNKEKINKEIKNIIKYNDEEELEDLLYYCLMEKRKDDLRVILPIIAKQKNIKSLILLKKYFLLNNNSKNYQKTINIIKKINNS